MQAIKGGYWPSWAYSYLPPSSISTSYFTHIYYAFLSPNNITYKFNIDDETASMLVNFTSTLRYSKNPPVKSIYSVGGAAEGPILFARMASCPLSRQRFIHSSIEVARKFGFDGIDLDWEHPLCPKEMEDYGILLEEWRKEIQKEAMQTSRPPLLLTAAVYYAAEFDSDVKRIYPSESMNKNLDWINAMTYDYHGSWDKNQTGAQAALYDSRTNFSTDYGISSWLNAGISREKLIMGLPIYGRSWKLKDPTVYEIGAPAVDVGPGFNGTGVMTYAEILEYNMQNTNATVVYDSDTVSTYSVFGTDWIGYDDTRSIAAKIGYAQAQALGGYFFWALNGDHEWTISSTGSFYILPYTIFLVFFSSSCFGMSHSITIRPSAHSLFLYIYMQLHIYGVSENLKASERIYLHIRLICNILEHSLIKDNVFIILYRGQQFI
ncbi:hypothetical protein Leryth_015911 [Lithospermum erythrorhizon]|nr:hypothetical protein Leryth_015911 [Lithospermum erythrorhizon]